MNAAVDVCCACSLVPSLFPLLGPRFGEFGVRLKVQITKPHVGVNRGFSCISVSCFFPSDRGTRDYFQTVL